MVLLLPRLLADLPKAGWEEVSILSPPACPQEPMPTQALLYPFPFLFISGKYKHLSYPTITHQVQLCGLVLVLSLSERKFSGGKSQCVPDRVPICSLNDKILFPCQGHHCPHHYQWALELQDKNTDCLFSGNFTQREETEGDTLTDSLCTL